MENREGIIEFVKEAYPITKGKYRIPLAVTEFFIEKEKLSKSSFSFSKQLLSNLLFMKKLLF